MTFREMTLADVDAGLRLCRLSHWNQLARDWEQFLTHDPHAATLAIDDDGQVVGSVTTMRFAAAPSGAVTPSLAWVAMVLVDPSARGRGTGTALLERGMASVDDAMTLGLDATPLGQPLYEKLGFRVASTFTRMERAAATPCGVLRDVACSDPGGGVDTEVRPLATSDLGDVDRLDARATGLDRSAMLAWLHEGLPSLARVRTRAGTISGFVLGRRGHVFHHVGPVIAASLDDAAGLLQACVADHQDTRLIVDIADGRSGWRAAVETLGFTAQRPFARMYRGEWRPEGDDSLLFASIGPEFG